MVLLRKSLPQNHNLKTAAELDVRLKMEMTYEICLADYEPLLPEMANIIKAKYEPGSYSQAENNFHTNCIDLEEWVLLGELGSLVVKFEKYEGYYFSKFEASDQPFKEGKFLLWRSYIAQGGNAAVQENP